MTKKLLKKFSPHRFPKNPHRKGLQFTPECAMIVVCEFRQVEFCLSAFHFMRMKPYRAGKLSVDQTCCRHKRLCLEKRVKF